VRAHLPDVAPELMSELETRLRAFICNCSRCSLGMFRRGSYGCRGERGRSYGNGHLGRHEGRDCSIMIVQTLQVRILRESRCRASGRLFHRDARTSGRKSR
jgi:hypothetical protein